MGVEEADGKTALLHEVQALRDCIAKGEVAIQHLAPKLLEAACTGKDLKLLQSAACLQAAALSSGGDAEGDYHDKESSQAQSRAESRDCPPSPVAAQGRKSMSCFSGCFRGA